MTVQPAPCLVRGLGKETAAGADQGSLGIIGLRDADWPAAYGAIGSVNGLKYDPTTGQPYVDPIGAPVLTSAVIMNGRAVSATPDSNGISMLAGAVPSGTVSLTNTNHRPVKVWMDFNYSWRLKLTYAFTSSGLNERYLTPWITFAVGSLPAEPPFNAASQGTFLSAAIDSPGYGGWVATGGYDNWTGWILDTLLPGQTINVKFTVGYSTAGAVAGIYDYASVPDLGLLLKGYSNTAPT